MCGGPSNAQYTAQEQAQTEANQLQSMYTQQFGEQQGLLTKFLVPQLEGMIADPTGFGPAGLAAMTAQLVDATGQAAESAKQSANAAFDTNNLAGLPSGVQQAVNAQINSAAGNQVVSGKEQIDIANAQLKNQQQQFGISNLAQADQLLGAAPQTVTGALNANSSSASQAYNIAQQGSAWSNILGGVISGVVGGGMDALTGGMSGLFKGGGGGGGFTFPAGTVSDLFPSGTGGGGGGISSVPA